MLQRRIWPRAHTQTRQASGRLAPRVLLTLSASPSSDTLGKCPEIAVCDVVCKPGRSSEMWFRRASGQVQLYHYEQPR